MKKIIVLTAVFSSFVMCKKGEAISNENYANSDSAIATVEKDTTKLNIEAPKIEKIKDSIFTTKENTDGAVSENQMTKNSSTVTEHPDSISVAEKEEKPKTITKNVDRVSKNTQQPINISVTPKIVKETKIIYQNRPQKVDEEAKKVNRLRKEGTLSIRVENLEQSNELAKEEILKYDGIIKSENVTGNQIEQNSYLQIKVPIQKFEYLVNELSEIGIVENKEFTTTGENHIEGTLCNLDLVLKSTSEKAIISGKAEGFGGRSFSAISTGWNVIKEIILFLLPFWPIYMIIGILFYFYKGKRNKKLETADNE